MTLTPAGDESAIVAAARTARAILSGRDAGWVNFRQDALAMPDAWGRFAGLIKTAVVLGCLLLAALAGTFYWMGTRYDAITRGYENRQLVEFRRLCPNQPAPPNITSRLQSQFKAASAASGTGFELPDRPCALETLQRISAGLPSEVRLRIVEMRIDSAGILIEGQTRSHGDAEIISRGLKRAGLVKIETGDYISDIGCLRQSVRLPRHVPLEEGIRRSIAFYRHEVLLSRYAGFGGRERKREGMNRILLVRHCQSQHHLDRAAGADSHLTDLGREQSVDIAERLQKDLDGQTCRLVSSDFHRAWETATVLAERLGIEPIAVPELREWRGKMVEQMTSQEKHRMVEDRRWFLFDWPEGPDVESWRSFYDRVAHFMERIAKSLSDEELLQEPLDVTGNRLVRMHVFRVHEGIYLLVRVHHIICDGWSFGVMLRDLEELIAARMRGHLAMPAEIKFQYLDFVLWQKEYLKCGASASDRAYWRLVLEKAYQRKALPYLQENRPSCSENGVQGLRKEVQIDLDVNTALALYAKKLRVTEFDVYLAIYFAMIGRLSDSRDLMIGIALNGRPQKEWEDTVGLFATVMPLRVDMTAAKTFSQIVALVLEAKSELLRHQAYPFHRLREDAFREDSNLSLDSLISTCFQYHHQLSDFTGPEPVYAAHWAEPVPTPILQRRWMPKFDLSLVITRSAAGLRQHFELRTDDHRGVEFYCSQYREVLTRLTAKLEQE